MCRRAVDYHIATRALGRASKQPRSEAKQLDRCVAMMRNEVREFACVPCHWSVDHAEQIGYVRLDQRDEVAWLMMM